MRWPRALPCSMSEPPCCPCHKPLKLAQLLAALTALIVWSCGIAAADNDKYYSQLLLNSPDQWPAYAQGKGQYKWVLSKRALQKSITYLGSHDRLRVALSKLQSGQNITITTLGGSITAGQGRADGLAWPEFMINYLKDNFGEQVQLKNGAVPGTLSAYMSACMNVHVPTNSDIIFVEYNINDHGNVLPPFNNNERRHYERLLRKLLSLPNKPAVIQLYTYSWLMPGVEQKGNFWYPCDREFDELAHYYGIPTVSLKACCWQLLYEQPPGFWRNVTRTTDMFNLKEKAFYLDIIHPDGNTGTRVLFELAVHLLETVLNEMKVEPVSAEDQAAVQLPLPEPMILKNYHSDADRCFMGRQFTHIITKKEGFEWINDHRNKWGMVATQPGSFMEITIDTRAPAQGDTSPGAALFGQGYNNEVLVELAYLESYERMGRASIECFSGCTCPVTQIEGHIKHHSSQLNIKTIYVSQHEKCGLKITVLPDSSSGQHKVKIAALIVRDESGKIETYVQSYYMTIEHAHDLATGGAKRLLRYLTSQVRRLRAFLRRL